MSASPPPFIRFPLAQAETGQMPIFASKPLENVWFDGGDEIGM